MPYENFGTQPSTPLRRLCLLIILLFAFAVGLLIGVLLPFIYVTTKPSIQHHNQTTPTTPNSTHLIDSGIYWSSHVERLVPEGFRARRHHHWSEYVGGSARAIKLTEGCGRMQNRLVTFTDGQRACVRYRQNTDQIQGELFSYYLGHLLGLDNLTPSTVTLVDIKSDLWKDVGVELTNAQWALNRPVVLTEFIDDLRPSPIPRVFRPIERHLNRNDLIDLPIDDLIELIQWSDLIIFDYLTANLDRVVNNLYNYQWNAHIMEAPAHNLAKKEGLLVFLDNESGLLHGYRLLKKYEAYHSILLDALCIFRKRTANAVRALSENGHVGHLLRHQYEIETSGRIRDVLPPLPDKSVKILNERLARVVTQIDRCASVYGR